LQKAASPANNAGLELTLGPALLFIGKAFIGKAVYW